MTTPDARRCPRHPSVTISSPDGLFDAPCDLCEAEAELDELEAEGLPPLGEDDAPELGPDFFEDAVLTAPGEDLIERLEEERYDAPANDMKGRPR